MRFLLYNSNVHAPLPLFLSASLPHTNSQAALMLQVLNRRSRGRIQRVTVRSVGQPGLWTCVICKAVIWRQELSQVNENADNSAPCDPALKN